MKKLLVTGASGFLGWHVCIAAADTWRVYGTVWKHPFSAPFGKTVGIDLTNADDTQRVLSTIRPDAVIHAAALANPEVCQQHAKEAHAINVTAAANIARYCHEQSVQLVFTSTDIVFDGLNPPYREDDPVCPVNAYGHQKVLAENKTRSLYAQATICRLPLLFGQPGPAGQSFLQHLLVNMCNRRPVTLFKDEYRTPISAPTAAAGLLLVLDTAPRCVHLGGNERISRYDFGCMVADVFGLDQGLIVGGSQKDANMLACRPPDVSLDNQKARTLGFSPPDLASELIRLRDMNDWRKQLITPHPG
jgi:dTDP-4-dehydrorhamnose reductase